MEWINPPDVNELRVFSFWPCKPLCVFPWYYFLQIKCKECLFKRTQDDIIELFGRVSGGIMYSQVSWFGGERHRAIKITGRLVAKIINLCEENNVSCHSDSTADAHFLNQKNKDWLQQLSIQQIEVTVG